MNARLVRAAAVAAVAAASSACLVGPAWRTPRTDVPPAFRAPADAGPSLAELEWPALFQDPTLQGLIRDALARNHDVRIAAARVEAAAAQAGVARAALYPSIGYAASAARVDGSDTMVPGAGAPYNDYAAQATITWEADLWGKLRRTSESARESFLATEEARRAVAISLVANVAGLYCQLREFDAELEIARRTLAGRRENTRLIKGRFDGGVTSELDFRQAQIQEGDAAATIAALERSRALTENALNLLLGRAPGDVPRGLALDAQPVPPAIAPGLPSELLARRPDILAAEHAAHAALAQVGAAKALQSKSFLLSNPTAAADSPLWRVGSDLTVTAVHVLCYGGVSITGQFGEYDANGANGSAVDSDIYAAAGTDVADDGAIGNAGIAAGNYLGWKTTSVTGAVSRVIITVSYTE